MKLHELIVLQEILKREEEVTKGHILITREKLQTLQTLKNERDNSDLSSDRMLDNYEDRLKKIMDYLKTVESLVDLVNNSEFTIG